MHWLYGGCFFLAACARTRTKQARKKQPAIQPVHRYIDALVVWRVVSARVCVCICIYVRIRIRTRTHTRTHTHTHTHARSCMKSISIYFIRILFPSNPIHELRLNQTVANTVIALTIRVI